MIRSADDEENPQNELKKTVAECEKSFQQWQYLYDNGGQDPFWPDGVNLNLVRNHILCYKDKMSELCGLLSAPLPEIYNRTLPPKVDSEYIARKDEIAAGAKAALSKMKTHPSYLKLLQIKSQYSQKQLESICYGAVVGYVFALESAIQSYDYITMRRYKNCDSYLDSFDRCLKRAESLKPEEYQLSLFDIA